MPSIHVDNVSIESVVTVVMEEKQVVVSDGVIGPPGAQGVQGAPGLSGASYVHDQGVAVDTWVITHNLGRFPSVVTVDSSGDEVEGAIRYDSVNQITITFSAAFGGKAYLN